MRRPFTSWACVLIAFLAAGRPAVAATCPSETSARARPGQDDVVVLLDSSLSMGPTSFGPWARGSMDAAREVLLRLVDCYLQPGDFVLVGTFDSEARIEIAKEIAQAPRDLETLREQIAALGPSRPRYWERRPDGSRGGERASDGGANRIAGGSLRTDLGAALLLADRVLRDYSSPDHRQLVLLFTDGEHDPPEFSPFRGEDLVLEDLLPREAVVHHRLGLVALPGEGGDVAPGLLRLIERWDPGGEARRHGELALIELEADASLDRQIAHLAEEIEGLLSMRIDLLAPPILELGSAFRPRVDRRLTVANRSRTARTIEIAEAVWIPEGAGAEVPLGVAPRRFEIPAEGRAELHLGGNLGELPTGAYRGRIRFRFGTSAGFLPAHLPVEGLRVSWLEAYGRALVLALLLAAILAAGLVLYRRRPIWLAMTWSDGTRTERSVPRKLRTGERVRFGGRGHGGLEVDGPARRLGAVHRPRSNRFLLEWEAGTEPGAEAATRALVARKPESVPDAPGRTVVFLLHHHRKQLECDLEALAPRRDSRAEESESLLESTTF